MSSLRDSYRTPRWLFAALDREFGLSIDLACDDSNNVAGGFPQVAPQCTREKDCTCGLHQKFADYEIYCNPPYSNLMPWIRRFAQLAEDGNTVVTLLPVDTSTAWWEEMIASVHELRFIRKRVNFLHAPDCGCEACINGRKPAGNNKPNVVAIWRPCLKPPAPVVHWGWWPREGYEVWSPDYDEEDTVDY